MKQFFLIISILFLFSCGNNSGKKMHRGDIVHIKTECVGCYTESDLDKVIKAANSKNHSVFMNSLAKTDHVMLFKGEPVTVMQIKVGKVNVEYRGKSVWVMYKHIKK